jgi:hypothetical protein
MVSFFFYKNFINIDLIKQISLNFEIDDGYIIVKNYDIENNILEIDNNQNNNNNIILHGKIVNFNSKLDEIIKKINEFHKFIKDDNKKYTLNTIWANKKSGGLCKSYIIY